MLERGCYIGLNNICIGSRQSGREIGKNTIMIENDEKILFNVLKKIIHTKKNKKRDFKYGNGDAGKKIVKILEKIDFKFEKNYNINSLNLLILHKN